MFDLFKRNKKLGNGSSENNATSEITRESVFPTAEEMLAESSQKWPQLTAEVIVEKLHSESASGERKAFFYNSTLSVENKEELKKQGYRVEQGEIFGTPFVKIFW